MKTTIHNLKQFILKNTILHIFIFFAVTLASVFTAFTIYQDVKQLILAQPSGAWISCIFAVMQ
jgi:hypothetical protein